VDGLVSTYHLGQVGLCAVDGVTGSPATNGGRTKKTWAQPPRAAWRPSRLREDCCATACRGRFGTSSSASCWRHRSAWNAFWHGLHGAAGIKVWPNIGTTSDAQFHNYNGSTRERRAIECPCRDSTTAHGGTAGCETSRMHAATRSMPRCCQSATDRLTRANMTFPGSLRLMAGLPWASRRTCVVSDRHCTPPMDGASHPAAPGQDSMSSLPSTHTSPAPIRIRT
jgi:hypothetical protein